MRDDDDPDGFGGTMRSKSERWALFACGGPPP